MCLSLQNRKLIKPALCYPAHFPSVLYHWTIRCPDRFLNTRRHAWRSLVWTSQQSGLMKTKTSCNMDVVSSSLPHGSAVTVLSVVQNLNDPKLIIYRFITQCRSRWHFLILFHVTVLEFHGVSLNPTYSMSQYGVCGVIEVTTSLIWLETRDLRSGSSFFQRTSLKLMKHRNNPKKCSTF